MNKYFSVKTYEAKNAHRVLFFFPAGFTQIWHYRWTVYVLNRMGITVVGFNFEWKRAIRKFTFEDLLGLIYEVDKVVDMAITASPTLEYSTLGLSFGSVLTLHTAKQHTAIKSVVLFVPYGTLSHLLWTHKPSRPFIQNLINAGLKTEQDLEKLTEPVETALCLEKLVGTKIVSCRGMNDKIVFDGEVIEDAIRAHDPESPLYRLPFGHFWTCVVGILQTRKWTKVL